MCAAIVPPVRVVVVDDSVVIRRVLSDILSTDPAIEVVATAGNGRIGLDKIRSTKPDIVTLDIEMPVMDGIETLTQLRKEFPNLPVLMFSTLTTRGGTATLDALALGATDYLTKPESFGGRDAAISAIRAELLPKVKILGRRRTFRAGTLAGTAPAPAARPVLRRPPAVQRIDVVAVAVSTGGPKALQDVIPALPAGLPVPVVIVQHMPPVFTGLLAERLDRTSAVHVVEGATGTELRAGTVYIAPGGRHMLVEKRGTGPAHIVCNDDPPENSCKPAADPMFRSVAKAFGAHALGVVLTGMGNDGCHGAQALASAGCEILAQDESSSVVWGMPGAVVHAGLASAEVPLARVADEIVLRVAHQRNPVRTGTGALR